MLHVSDAQFRGAGRYFNAKHGEGFKGAGGWKSWFLPSQNFLPKAARIGFARAKTWEAAEYPAAVCRTGGVAIAAANKPVIITLQYTLNNKNKPLHFLLNPGEYVALNQDVGFGISSTCSPAYYYFFISPQDILEEI